MKFGLKYAIILAWYVLATVLIFFIKLLVIMYHFLAILFGIIWQMKPFKVYVPVTFKHLWEECGYRSNPWVMYFDPDVKIKKMSYYNFYNFWK